MTTPSTSHVGDWKTGEEVLIELQPSDLIEFSRTMMLAGRKRRVYAHWAIYIGLLEDQEHYVVHISTDEGDFDVRPGQDSIGQICTKMTDGSTAKVRSEKFLRVAGTDACRINNSMDSQVKPLPPVIAVERALHRLGTGEYNLIDNNCEHFVKLCRYGVSQSLQSNKAILTLFGVTSLAAATLGNAPTALTLSFTYAAYVGLKRFRQLFLQ